MVKHDAVDVQATLLGMVTFDATRVCVLESGVRDAVSMDTFPVSSCTSAVAEDVFERLRQHEHTPPVDGGEYLTPCHISVASITRCLEVMHVRTRAAQCSNADAGLVAALRVAAALVACWQHVLGPSRAKLVLLCGDHSSATEAIPSSQSACSDDNVSQPQGAVSWLSAWFTSAVALVSPTKATTLTASPQAGTEWSRVQDAMVGRGISCVCCGGQSSPRLQHLASVTGGLLIPGGVAPLSAALLSLCTLPTLITLRIPRPLVPTRILGRVVQRCEFGILHNAGAHMRSGALDPDTQCCVYDLEVPWARCDSEECVAGLLSFTDVAPGPSLTLEAEVSVCSAVGAAVPTVSVRCDIVMTDDNVSAIKSMDPSVALALCVRESMADGLAAARHNPMDARTNGTSAIRATLKTKFQETMRVRCIQLLPVWRSRPVCQPRCQCATVAVRRH